LELVGSIIHGSVSGGKNLTENNVENFPVWGKPDWKNPNGA